MIRGIIVAATADAFCSSCSGVSDEVVVIKKHSFVGMSHVHWEHFCRGMVVTTTTITTFTTATTATTNCSNVCWQLISPFGPQQHGGHPSSPVVSNMSAVYIPASSAAAVAAAATKNWHNLLLFWGTEQFSGGGSVRIRKS